MTTTYFSPFSPFCHFAVMRAVFQAMEPRIDYKCILLVYISLTVTTLFTHSDARSNFKQMLKFEGFKLKKLRVSGHMDIDSLPLDPLFTESYGVSSPFSLPPFDSLAPLPLPENTPPFCLYPPFTPNLPSPRTYSPPPPFHFTPTFPIQSPPFFGPNPPEYGPSSPPTPLPYHGPSPPSYVPSPPKRVPISPPVYQPPVVHPPPSIPPPPKKEPEYTVWCVAKPTVPNPIIQEAMDYACSKGADCEPIKPNGSCYQPDTLFAHASYAFNSYWQRTKVAGGTCDFGGTAMLVTVDPSFDGCHFIYY